MLNFRSETHADFVEIDLVSQETDKLPHQGDGYLTLRVSSAGFCGHNDLWVSSSSLRSFCKELTALERSREGEATIASISLNELLLKIRSLNRRGHMAIEGATGYQVHKEDAGFWHAVHFGFKFDPSQLAAAVREEWVVANAALTL